MRLLLDTHAIIWSIAEPNRLSDSARALVVDPGNRVFASVVSAWEITIKRALGKLQFADLTDALLDRYGFEALPIELSHANRVARLPRPRCNSGCSRSPRPWPAPYDEAACTWPPGHRSSQLALAGFARLVE